MKIKKLPEEVINKIAAGEVVQRPSNAVKELIQNSIDAQATSIKLTIHDGGLKLIKINDNGFGINYIDFPLVCQRFATSKISKYEDLKQIGSFGFRGQALASLSYVSEVKIQSKRRGTQIAYTALYKNGVMLAEPKVEPHNEGTTISSTQLFESLKTRRQSLNPTDEKKRILKLVYTLAIHYSYIKFKVQSEKGIELTTENLAGTKIENKLKIFRDMNKLELDHFIYSSTALDDVQLQGIFTKINTVKVKVLYLFINNRLVESDEIFKTVQKAYSNCYRSIHQSNESFIVYLSLQMEPKYLDCNVHPTKKHVNFYNSIRLCDKLSEYVENIVKKQCSVKKLGEGVQSQLSFGDEIRQKVKSKQNYAFQKNRTDSKQIPLRYFYDTNKQQTKLQKETLCNKQQTTVQKETLQIDRLNQISKGNTIIKPLINPNPPCVSIKNTQQCEQSQQIAEQQLIEISYSMDSKITSPDQTVKELFRQLTYVGCFNLNYIFIQYSNKLYMMNVQSFICDALRTWIAKQKVVYSIKIDFNLEEELRKLKQEENLNYSIEQCLHVITSYSKFLENRINIKMNGAQITRASMPLRFLQKQFRNKDFAYLLVRTVRLITKDQMDNIQLFEKFLLEFYESYFSDQNNVLSDDNQIYNRFFENKLIPLLKIHGSFSSIDMAKYMTILLDQKDVYKIFERC